MSLLKSWLIWAERQFGNYVEKVHTDGGGEFISILTLVSYELQGNLVFAF